MAIHFFLFLYLSTLSRRHSAAYHPPHQRGCMGQCHAHCFPAPSGTPMSPPPPPHHHRHQKRYSGSRRGDFQSPESSRRLGNYSLELPERDDRMPAENATLYSSSSKKEKKPLTILPRSMSADDPFKSGPPSPVPPSVPPSPTDPTEPFSPASTAIPFAVYAAPVVSPRRFSSSHAKESPAVAMVLTSETDKVTVLQNTPRAL